LYTEDAVLMIPNLEALEGHAGAARFFEAFENRGIAEVRLRTIEVEDFGHNAWERGRAEQLRSDGSVLGRSKYIVIWKRTEAGWRIYRDIMNPDAPPA
jgi:ketosteroid isomerase-like protein